MVKVSVILPVYGVTQYIEKCAQSLLDQTLQEMEFIFVDDHGPDNSIELVQKMIENHPRKEQFVFLKPEHNMGAGMARNYAIPYAKGEYIAFVDSDDWIEPTMFEELYNEAIAKGGVDLCCGQASKDYLDGRPSEILKNPEVASGKLTREKRSYFLTHYVSLFWTFIYKKEMVEKHHIRYPESRSADDSYFVTSNLLLADSIAYVNKPFYHYLIRPGSVCSTKDSTKYQKRLATFTSLMSFLKEKGCYAGYKNEIDFIYIKKGYLSSVFNYVVNSTTPRKEVLNEIYSELLKEIPDYKKNPFYKSKKTLQILICCIRHCPNLAVKIIKNYATKKELTV